MDFLFRAMCDGAANDVVDLDVVQGVFLGIERVISIAVGVVLLGGDVDDVVGVFVEDRDSCRGHVVRKILAGPELEQSRPPVGIFELFGSYFLLVVHPVTQVVPHYPLEVIAHGGNDRAEQATVVLVETVEGPQGQNCGQRFRRDGIDHLPQIASGIGQRYPGLEQHERGLIQSQAINRR
ncbi:hypothetical protein D3C85_1305920 [compost metagenome]